MRKTERRFEEESEETIRQRRNENRARLQEEDTAETYTVRKGDSLWWIAERYYGDGERWIDIYEKNIEKIGGNPSLIFEGMELTL